MDNHDDDEAIEGQIKELSAQVVQNFWRRFRTIRALQQVVKSKRSPIVVYYSSINFTQKTKSDTDKLIFMLNAKKLNFFKFDLVDNKMAQDWVKNILNKYSLPFVKINDIFVGGYEEFEVLYEADFLQRIVNKDYERQCILCDADRQEGDNCGQCSTAYLFFKSD